MAFTDRFIKVPCELINKKNEEMGIEDDNSIESFIMINPFEISRYHPTCPNHDTDELTQCKVVFKDGDSIVLDMTVKELEKILNSNDPR